MGVTSNVYYHFQSKISKIKTPNAQSCGLLNNSYFLFKLILITIKLSNLDFSCRTIKTGTNGFTRNEDITVLRDRFLKECGDTGENINQVVLSSHST